MRQAVTGQENQSDFSKIQRIHTAVGQQYRLNSRALLQENGEVMFICRMLEGFTLVYHMHYQRQKA